VSWQPAGPALLFCPADRPERYGKAADAGDVVIVDLEDGVAPADRPAARQALASATLDPERTVVRINPAGTADHDLDLAALDRTPYDVVMLAKADRAEQVRALAPLRVVALCETPAGILAAPAIAEHAAALMWGAEDLIAALGGRSSRRADGSFRAVAAHARSAVLLAAGAAGLPAIDTVSVDIADVATLAAQAEEAAGCGFAAVACIHPSQVEVVRAAYRPGPEELDWARRVLAAAVGERGAFRFDGRMVDAPVLRHAEQIVTRAG
jgi:citrate lyase subunit beta/citryl-CoA lyase